MVEMLLENIGGAWAQHKLTSICKSGSLDWKIVAKIVQQECIEEHFRDKAQIMDPAWRLRTI